MLERTILKNTTANDDFTALLLDTVQYILIDIHSLTCVKRTTEDTVIKRVTHLDLSIGLLESFDQVVVHRLLYDQTTCGSAALAGGTYSSE
jgi:hypothetical protein